MFFVFTISLFAGIYSAMNFNTKKDESIKQIALFSYAFPSFYIALLFIIILSVEFGMFPISGLHSVDEENILLYYIDMGWHLFLPILVIVIGGVGSLTLYIRSLTLEILKSDYIFFAKTRGVKGKKLFLNYIIPNLYPPIITILGLSLPALIGGSVILESIFSINGMGLLFYQSALSRDYPVIMGILIIGAFLTLLGNIIADLILLKINPYTSK
jgi:peptide/nickel transport system permease protein